MSATAIADARLYTRFRSGASMDALAAQHRIPREAVEAAIRSRLVDLERLATPAIQTRAERRKLARRSLEIAARRLGVPVAAAAVSRKREHVHARWVAWLALVNLGWSQNTVARAFGVDHTSIMNALGAAPDNLAPHIEHVVAELRGEGET